MESMCVDICLHCLDRVDCKGSYFISFKFLDLVEYWRYDGVSSTMSYSLTLSSLS